MWTGAPLEQRDAKDHQPEREYIVDLGAGGLEHSRGESGAQQSSQRLADAPRAKLLRQQAHGNETPHLTKPGDQVDGALLAAE